MPLFAEGQDPLDQQQPGASPVPVPPIAPQASVPDELKPLPGEVGSASLLGAGMRSELPGAVYTAAMRQRPDATPQDGYNAFDDPQVKGTPAEFQYQSQLMGMNNPNETRAFLAQAASEESDRQALANSPGGTAASVITGLTNPLYFVPVFGEAAGAGKALSIGARVLRGAAEFGLQSAVSEEGMQASQVSRPLSQSVENVATGAIFGGLIGAGAHFLAPGERAAGEAGLDRVRADFSEPGAVPLPPTDIQALRAERTSGGLSQEHMNALDSASSAGWSVEHAKQDVVWAHENDRPDIAQAIVERAQAYADAPVLKPGVSEDNPRYAEIQANLVASRQWDVAHAADLKALSDEHAQSSVAPSNDSAAADLGATSVGAAASDQRDMQLSKILPDSVHRLIAAVPGGDAALSVINRGLLSMSPSGRTFLSGSLPGRRAMGDLAETSLKFSQAARGVTAARGVPIDRMVKMQMARFVSDTRDILADAYQKYRGTDGSTIGRVKAQFGPVPEGIMSFTDFKTQVHLAGTQGDVHAIPAVSEAARNLREQVYKPVERLAQATKGADGRPMLSDELAPPAGDQSFAPRVWNKKAIAADPNTFDRITTDWLMSEQATKADAKERLTALQERHEALGEQADRLDGRLQTIGQRMTDTATRADEVGQSVRRGDKRADVLDARADEIKNAISELQEFADTMNDRYVARAPDAAAHLAELNKEIAALRKEGAPLSKTELDRIEREEVKTTFTPEQRRGAEWAMGNGKAPKKPSALQYFREGGGINDVGGDAASVLGRGFQRDAKLRGIVKDNGVLGGGEAMSADQWGEKLAGDFPEHFNGERATPDEVHELLASGARGDEPEWFTQGREPANVAAARQHEAVFSDLLHHIDEHLGKRPANIREFAAQLSELDGVPSAVLRREHARIGALVERGGVEGARDEAQGARKELLNLVGRALKRREVEEGRLGKAGAAAGERGVEQTAVKGRVAILESRQVRQQTIKDLLERARANAEDERTALRGKMEDEIRAWKGDASADAISALKVRDEAERVRGLKQEAGAYEGKGERLTGADGPVDRAVRNIIKSDRDLSRGEILDRAREIRNRINTSADGRLPYDIASGGPAMGYPPQRNAPVSSLNRRDFAIPTHSVLPFIHTDPEHVVPTYLRTLLPDLHLTQRFGDAEMTEQFKQINEFYDKKLAGVTGEKKLARIDAARQAETRDLAATRDRVRSVFGMPTTPSQRNLGRISRAVGNWNVGAFLGTSMLNRFQDMANATGRRGMMGYMRDGFIPYFKGLSGVEAGSAALRQSVRDMGVGVDTTMGHLASQFADVTDNHLPGNRFERGLAAAASTAMIVTGHGPWTDLNKQIAGMAASADFLRMAERIATSQPAANDIRTMAHAGIDPAMAARIHNAFENGGHTVVGEAKVPNTADWQDAGARQAFEAAIQKDADIAVVTPGAEKPLFLSDPVYSMLGQFKGFAAAAQERILLSNLQEADGRTLQGFLHMMAMGMLSYKAYTLATGQATSDRPQDWIKEAITRAGLMGWMGDLNSTQAKFFGGKTDVFNTIGAGRPLTRHQSQSALAELLGPTFAELQGVAEGLNDATHGTWTAQDTHKLRQTLYLQNHFMFRGLLDKAEDGINQSQGIQPMNRNPTTWPGN